jgi:hypothetical protein
MLKKGASGPRLKIQTFVCKIGYIKKLYRPQKSAAAVFAKKEIFS